jgi:hypothetical protein
MVKKIEIAYDINFLQEEGTFGGSSLKSIKKVT